MKELVNVKLMKKLQLVAKLTVPLYQLVLVVRTVHVKMDYVVPAMVIVVTPNSIVVLVVLMDHVMLTRNQLNVQKMVHVMPIVHAQKVIAVPNMDIVVLETSSVERVAKVETVTAINL